MRQIRRREATTTDGTINGHRYHHDEPAITRGAPTNTQAMAITKSHPSKHRQSNKDIDVDCKSSIVQTIAAESIRHMSKKERPRETEGEYQVQESKEETLDLSTESVEGSSLSLECVDDVEGCDSLALGVFSVGD